MQRFDKMQDEQLLTKLSTRPFIQIPGPNPILIPGEGDDWDSSIIECCNVFKDGETYYLYYDGVPLSQRESWTYRIGAATARHPLGPWKKYEGNLVIKPDDWGSWEDGGYSEAGVLHHDGIFHMFYGGTKWEKPESIGYACSLDGIHFVKHVDNPVATRTPFRLFMPVLSFGTLKPGEVSNLNHQVDKGKTVKLTGCPPISLEAISAFSLTTECSYTENARAGLRVHIKSSVDGLHYDTEDLYSFDVPLRPGQRVRKTQGLDADIMFVKVQVENLDSQNPISDVKVTATLRS